MMQGSSGSGPPFSGLGRALNRSTTFWSAGSTSSCTKSTYLQRHAAVITVKTSSHSQRWTTRVIGRIGSVPGVVYPERAVCSLRLDA
eukprot:2836863-Rhodomonas_salina.1